MDKLYIGEPRGNEGGIAPGGDDMETAGRAELAANLDEDLADEAAIAIDRPGKHGLAGGAADGGGGLGGADAGEQGGALEEVIGHDFEAGSDDAADVIAGCGEDIEGYGGAEIDDDGGGTVEVADGGGVGEAVCANGVRTRIIDAGAEIETGADGEKLATPDLRGKGAEGEAGLLRDYGGEDDFLAWTGHALEGGEREAGGGETGDAMKGTGGGGGELGEGVADIDEEIFGRGSGAGHRRD